jgi:hypothetical protein
VFVAGGALREKSSAPDVRDDVLAERTTLAGFDGVHAEDRIAGGRRPPCSPAAAGAPSMPREPP